MTDPSSLPPGKTIPLYQTKGSLYTHTAPITSLTPLSCYPVEVQSLFKPPPSEPTAGTPEPYILTTPSTIFHAQGGGQPSDTGCITTTAGRGGASSSEKGEAKGGEEEEQVKLKVHQVRSLDGKILHLCTLPPSPLLPQPHQPGTQEIHIPTRTLHSRLHTAGHILGLAAASLRNSGILPPDLVDGKASHYPGASFVEFEGLIPGSAKAALQERTDELVARDLGVGIAFWDEERVGRECVGGSGVKGDERGVRVVQIGDVGSYPCGGTHVETTKACGRVVIRNIKRQKGITKVSYEVQDA